MHSYLLHRATLQDGSKNHHDITFRSSGPCLRAHHLKSPSRNHILECCRFTTQHMTQLSISLNFHSTRRTAEQHRFPWNPLSSLEALIPSLSREVIPFLIEEVKLVISRKMIPFLLEEVDSLIPSSSRELNSSFLKKLIVNTIEIRRKMKQMEKTNANSFIVVQQISAYIHSPRTSFLDSTKPIPLMVGINRK